MSTESVDYTAIRLDSSLLYYKRTIEKWCCVIIAGFLNVHSYFWIIVTFSHHVLLFISHSLIICIISIFTIHTHTYILIISLLYHHYRSVFYTKQGTLWNHWLLYFLFEFVAIHDDDDDDDV